MLKYRPDPDLAFLATCSSDQLDRLVTLCIFDENGKPRVGRSLDFAPEFKSCRGDYRRIWHLIAAEVQRFGADTLMSVFRAGKGVLYQEIVADVARAIKAQRAPHWPIERQEEEVLQTFVANAFMKMSDAQKAEEFASGIEAQLRKLSPKQRAAVLRASKLTSLAGITPTLAYGLMATGVKYAGFTAYQMLVIGLNAVASALRGKGLSLAANALATRAAGAVFGPVGWIFAAASVVPLVTGPAFRVTIPAVLHVALLREEHTRQILDKPSVGQKPAEPPASKAPRKTRKAIGKAELSRTTKRKSRKPRRAQMPES